MNISPARLLRPAMALAVLMFAAMVHAQPLLDRFTSVPIPGRYIVVFKDIVPEPAREAAALVGSFGGRMHFTYARVMKGFAATLPDAAVQALRNNPLVESIEQDQTVTLSTIQQENQATWGLDRVDQVDLPLDTVYHYGATGAGVTAFIIDTGIRADHAEFTGRLLPGYTSISDGNGTNDCNGHGTHVAGTTGGTTWGIAKQVKLVPVRVLDCNGSGTYSGVIAGVDWVAASTQRPAVANMSLGGSLSSSLNTAVAGAVSKGVTMVVAAGNSSADACKYSPSSEPSAITVGATTSSDARASYSNYGTCLDLFAPGSSITSAWNTSSTATNTLSGTSMATPHVTGAAALVLESNPAASPAAVATFLASHATTNHVTSAGSGSPNLLLYSLGTGTATEPAVPVVAVKSLSGSATRAGRGWRATATITIRDINTNAAVANAKVAGSFSPGASNTCTTGSNGSCSIGSGTLNTRTGSTVFTVTGVTGNLTYQPDQNTASQIVITKP